jgi:hypothetical protein
MMFLTHYQVLLDKKLRDDSLIKHFEDNEEENDDDGEVEEKKEE